MSSDPKMPRIRVTAPTSQRTSSLGRTRPAEPETDLTVRHVHVRAELPSIQNQHMYLIQIGTYTKTTGEETMLDKRPSSNSWLNRKLVVKIIIFIISFIAVFVADLNSIRGRKTRLDNEFNKGINTASSEQGDANGKINAPTTQTHSVKFVFLMGLQGAGHHLVTDLTKHAPNTKRLHDIVPSFPEQISQLAQSLYHENDPGALLNSHCFNSKNASLVNGTYSLTRVIENLDRLERLVRNQTQNNTNDKQQQLSVIINAWDENDIPSFNHVGSISYPNNLPGNCSQKLNYPNLDLFYHACTLANVQCQHVYIHRHPSEILRETLLLKTNETKPVNQLSTLAAVHLYTSHLNIIYSQLVRHGYRTAGCWGLFNDSLSKKDMQDMYTSMSEIFGWSDVLSFETVWKTIYRRSNGVMLEEEQSMQFASYEPYLQSFYEIHNDVVMLCRSQIDLYDTKEGTLLPSPVQKKLSTISPVKVKKFNSTAEFVFVIGLEGVGHHILGSFLNKPAPITSKLGKMRAHILPLGEALFCNRCAEGDEHLTKHDPLLNSHCFRNRPAGNMTESLEDVASYLRQIEFAFQKKMGSHHATNNNPTAVFINGWGKGQCGMFSYPNFKGPCRQLDYPNVDLLYQACNLAEVDCKQVYLYRDPKAILRSTTMKRNFNKNGTLPAIHLYVSHLNFVYAQLARHGLRNVGCWGLFETVGAIQNLSRSMVPWEETWESFYKMLGWSDGKEFEHIWKKEYTPSSSFSENDDEELGLGKLKPYLDSWYELHYDTLTLCRKSIT